MTEVQIPPDHSRGADEWPNVDRVMVDSAVDAAAEAAESFRALDQHQVDTIVEAMSRAGIRSTGTPATCAVRVSSRGRPTSGSAAITWTCQPSSRRYRANFVTRCTPPPADGGNSCAMIRTRDTGSPGTGLLRLSADAIAHERDTDAEHESDQTAADPVASRRALLRDGGDGDR